MSGWLHLVERMRRALGGSAPTDSPAPQAGCPLNVPLPILAHRHPRQAMPPGPLEEGMVELEQDGFVLHIVKVALQTDGTIGDLPAEKLEEARRLSYHHLKREGCLHQYGIPIVAVYETMEEGKPQTASP